MTKNGGSRNILYNRCSNQELKRGDDDEEEEKEEMLADGKEEEDIVGSRRLRHVLTPPPAHTSPRCASSTCCLPSLSTSSSLLLKVQFALFITLLLSAIPAFYLLRREWQIQQEHLTLQMADLNDKLRLYYSELDAFANGQYADFYAEPQTMVDHLPAEDETEGESTVVKSRGQRRHVMPTQSRRTVKKRLPPGVPVISRVKVAVAASTSSPHGKGKRLVPGSQRRSSVHVGSWDQGATSTAKAPTSAQHMTDTEYVWLTSHSRIPLYALKEFCQATRAHCIQDMEAFISSPEVNIRLRGEKGEKGAAGPAGHCTCPQSASTLRRSVPHHAAAESGSNGLNKSQAVYVEGSRGPPGPRGAKGERGPPGPPGVCAIKCIDEDLLPLRSSSYWSSSSIKQQPTPSAGSSLLLSTTNNPYLAQPWPQDMSTASTPLHHPPQDPSQEHSSATHPPTDATTSSPSAGDMQLPEPPRIWQDKDVITTSTSQSASAGSDGASMVDQPISSSTTALTSQQDNAYSVSETTSRSLPYEEVLGPMVNAEDLPTPSPLPPNGLTVAHSHAASPVGPLSADTLAHGDGYSSYPTAKLGLPLRKRSCLIEAIGKPVLLRSPPVAGEQASTTAWGSVMRDAHPATAEQAAKYYLTEQFTGRQLLEYASLAHFKLFTPTFKYSLPKTFRGVGHLVYNGSFYYHVDTQPLIVKFDLATERITAKKIVEGAAYRHGHYIYNLNKNYDYMDFAADEHGLWLIYTTDHSTNAMVAHLHPLTLDVLFTRNISFSHRHMGNAFVACGIFYGLSTVHFPYSHLVLAYDLLEDRYYQPPKEALFTNPRQKSVMVDYNPHDRKLYSYDDGWPLFFPLKFTQLNVDNL